MIKDSFNKYFRRCCWSFNCIFRFDVCFLICAFCYFLDEVAVIDEIQMIRDPQRGWAWTRALLGLVVNFTDFSIFTFFLCYTCHILWCKKLFGLWQEQPQTINSFYGHWSRSEMYSSYSTHIVTVTSVPCHHFRPFIVIRSIIWL